MENRIFKRHEAIWTRVLTHVCDLYRACGAWICARKESKLSCANEVEEKIRQNQALLQETTAEPTTEGTTTISNEG